MSGLGQGEKAPLQAHYQEGMLYISGEGLREAEFTIYAITGELVLRSRSTVIDVQGLNAGLYIVQEVRYPAPCPVAQAARG